MKRYFIKTGDLLNVIVSPLMDEQPDNSIEYYECGFLAPQFDQYPNPTKIVEGGNDLLDILKEDKLNSYNERLQTLVAELRIKAKGLAIGKTGSNSYILAQVDFYQRKYENASSTTPIAEVDADLANEGMRDFGLDLVTFKGVIISMYESGKDAENLLMCFIEQGRSAILTLMANGDWNKTDTAFSLAENMNGITSVEGARVIKNQILAL